MESAEVGNGALSAIQVRPVDRVEEARYQDQMAHHHYLGELYLMLAGRTAQLVRLRISLGDAYLPEISASKYALNICLLAPDIDQRPKQGNAE